MKTLKLIGLLALLAITSAPAYSKSLSEKFEFLVPDTISIGYDQLNLDGKIKDDIAKYGNTSMTGIIATIGWKLVIKENYNIDLEFGHVRYSNELGAGASIGPLGVGGNLSKDLGGYFVDTVFNYKVNSNLKAFGSFGAGYFDINASATVDGHFNDDRTNLFAGNVTEESWVPRIGLGFKFTPTKNWEFAIRQTHYFRSDESKAVSTGAFITYRF